MDQLLLFVPPLLIAGAAAALIVRLGAAAAPGAGPDTTSRPLDLIAAENNRLAGQVGRLEERLASLERSAGDHDRRAARRTVLR